MFILSYLYSWEESEYLLYVSKSKEKLWEIAKRNYSDDTKYHENYDEGTLTFYEKDIGYITYFIREIEEV